MKSRFVVVTALVICAVAISSFAADAPDANRKVPASFKLQLAPAVERTPQQMDAADAVNALNGAVREVPFRPTMSAAQYAAIKSAPAAATRPGIGSALPTAGGTILAKFVGVSQCQGDGLCWYPPDVAGSIGKTQFVSVSNNVFSVFSRSGLLLKTNSLNGFFGYFTTSMFDPRVQYDEEYQRWVITADSFQDSSNNQFLGIAVSQTSSATGKWWIYFVNTKNFDASGGFYDYPMLGLTQDAAVFTANEFSNSNGVYSTLFSVAKARIYNGFGFGVPVFKVEPTLQTTHQLVTDQGYWTWLIAGTGSNLHMYVYGAAANPNASAVFGPYTVTGDPGYSPPPPANQPAACGGNQLDSLDGRFQQTTTQNGDVLYAVHTVAFGPATVRYYVINGLSSFTPNVAAWNYLFRAASSNDFNPSIVADASGRFGINWSFTNPSAGTLASESFIDNNGGNPAPGQGVTVAASTACWNAGRWGDYSQTSYDPGTGAISNLNTATFWGDNEIIPGNWSTEVFKAKY